MERRELLAILGGGGAAAIGGGAVYSTLIRPDGSPADPPSVDYASRRDDLDNGAGASGDSDPSEADDAMAEIDEDDGAEAEANDDTDEDEQTNGDTRAGDFLLGVSPRRGDFRDLDPFETWLEERHAIIGLFLDMGQTDEEIEQLVHGSFESAWDRGAVPHIFWQPFFPDRESTSDDILQEIHEGTWDAYIEKWATEIADWATDHNGADRRLYLNLAPEFNGDWSPWSPAVGDDTEDDFVEMWQHVHDIVTDAGLEADHVQWVWTLDDTTRGVDREACYPGDDDVDWLAMHGYNWTNWGSWSSAPDVYGRTLDILERIAEKPMGITEFGCSSETQDGGNDPERKDEWIADAYEYVEERDVKMTLWFNIDRETDWSVFDADPGLDTVDIEEETYEVYPAYHAAVTGNAGIGSHPEHPRVLTDEEFWGEF